MHDRITQRQADTLWQELEAAAQPASGPAPYDFRRGGEAHPGHSFDYGHERLANDWSQRLAQALKRPVRGAPLAVDVMPAADLLESQMISTVIAVYRRGEPAQRLLLALPTVLVSVIVDLLLGGPGTASQLLVEPTPLAIATIQPTLAAMLADVLAIYQPGPPAVLEAIAADPRQLEAWAGEVAVLSTELELAGCKSPVHLALPLAWGLPGQEPAAAGETAQDPTPGLEHWLDDLAVNLRLCLGQVDLSVEELLQLQAGDVLTFGNAVDAPLTLWVEDRPAFYARSGKRGRQLAAQIVGTIDAEIGGDQ